MHKKTRAGTMSEITRSVLTALSVIPVTIFTFGMFLIASNNAEQTISQTVCIIGGSVFIASALLLLPSVLLKVKSPFDVLMLAIFMFCGVTTACYSWLAKPATYNDMIVPVIVLSAVSGLATFMIMNFMVRSSHSPTTTVFDDLDKLEDMIDELSARIKKKPANISWVDISILLKACSAKLEETKQSNNLPEIQKEVFDYRCSQIITKLSVIQDKILEGMQSDPSEAVK